MTAFGRTSLTRCCRIHRPRPVLPSGFKTLGSGGLKEPSEIDVVAGLFLWRGCLGGWGLEKSSRRRLGRGSLRGHLYLCERGGGGWRLLESERHATLYLPFVKGMHVLPGGRAPLGGKNLRDFRPRFAAAPQGSDRFPVRLEFGLEWFSRHEDSARFFVLVVNSCLHWSVPY